MITETHQEEAAAAAAALAQQEDEDDNDHPARQALQQADNIDDQALQKADNIDDTPPDMPIPRQARIGWAFAKKMTVENAAHASVKMLTSGILQDALKALHVLKPKGGEDVAPFDTRVALQEVMARRITHLHQKYSPIAQRLDPGLGGARLSKADWWEEMVGADALYDMSDFQKRVFRGRCVHTCHLYKQPVRPAPTPSLTLVLCGAADCTPTLTMNTILAEERGEYHVLVIQRHVSHWSAATTNWSAQSTPHCRSAGGSCVETRLTPE